MATKIYKGRYANTSDQILLIDGGKIYRGRYSNSSDEIKKVEPHGLLFKGEMVYKGKYANTSDQVMTIKGDKVYKGRYANTSDQIALISGDRMSDDIYEKVIYLIAQQNMLL